MAIEVQMSEDIRKYETKVFGPFDKRKLISMVIGAAYSIPLAIVFPGDITVKIFAFATAMSPAFACGYINYAGMKFERLFFRWLYLKILAPNKRKYKTVNSFREIEKQLKKEQEKELMEKMSKKELKKYLKAKNKPKQVKYSKLAQFKIYN